MEYAETTIETLRIEHARLDSEIKEEENLSGEFNRIEQLKKEKLRKKDELLRRALQSQ